MSAPATDAVRSEACAGGRLPSLAVIESALIKVTERLAVELTTPSTRPPMWSALEWQIAEAVSALQGLSSLLASELRWRGPARWQRFLQEQRHQCMLRYRLIGALLSQIDEAARVAGVGVVALKGAALLSMEVYRPGERPMGDVDLLVRKQDLATVARILESLGYREGSTTWRHVTFEPSTVGRCIGFGEHVDNPLRIEVHTRIAERLPIDVEDITSHVSNPSAPGMSLYPSLAALLRHLLLHAAGNMRARALRHIQLHDIGLIAARMTRDDWTTLLGPQAGVNARWWMLPPLLLTARYYPSCVPAFALAALEAECPGALKRVSARHRLSDVSWSNVRIEAFPGIEWSRSLSQALRFAASRVFPSASELSTLRHATLICESGAHVPWYNQSHLTRILRWTFGRPPRVQTMFAVRSALGDTPQPQ